MNKMLRHLVDRGEPIGIYFDDITVGGDTEEHHFQLGTSLVSVSDRCQRTPCCEKHQEEEGSLLDEPSGLGSFAELMIFRE